MVLLALSLAFLSFLVVSMVMFAVRVKREMAEAQQEQDALDEANKTRNGTDYANGTTTAEPGTCAKATRARCSARTTATPEDQFQGPHNDNSGEDDDTVRPYKYGNGVYEDRHAHYNNHRAFYDTCDKCHGNCDGRSCKYNECHDSDGKHNQSTVDGVLDHDITDNKADRGGDIYVGDVEGWRGHRDELGERVTAETKEPGTMEPGAMEPGSHGTMELSHGTWEHGTWDHGSLEPCSLEPWNQEPWNLGPWNLEPSNTQPVALSI
ncbi:hypothetical protein V5799_010324 [Amblyomma americanum]|uniref:Secreted protein n=1 Tax=Amblyomma americanum TaxID=6943 RepID=A0AAQ4F9B7_AMBAM